MARRDVETCDQAIGRRDIAALVIGASAGGVEALLLLAECFGAATPFPLVAVLHLPAEGPNLLPHLLTDSSRLAVKEGEPWESPRPGTLYLAPPGYHLSIESDGSFSLSTEEPVHFSRPSIDVLFESAAAVYRERLIAVLLTGANADGADGLLRVRDSGGIALVQDPESAKSPEMPQAALKLLDPDCVLSLSDLATVLRRRWGADTSSHQPRRRGE